MSHHRIRSLVTAPLLGAVMLVVALAGCSGPTGPGMPPPEGVPPHPDDAVVGSGWVLQDNGSPPELCFSVLLSRPPQCSGIELIGWDWSEVEKFETELGVTWGEYAVMGHFDGETITVTDVQPPSAIVAEQTGDPRRLPENPGTTTEADLARYQLQLHNENPFPIESSAPANGYLFVTVRWDDGTYQEWVDNRYGPDVVQIRSALKTVEQS